MPSPAPSAANGYLISFDTRLDPATLNAVLGSIHERMQAQEAKVADYDTAIAQLTAAGLDMIAENVGPQLLAAQNNLAELQALADLLEAQIVDIRNGGVDAVNVALVAISGLTATNLQAAIAELLGRLEELENDVDDVVEVVTEALEPLQNAITAIGSRNAANGYAGLDADGKLTGAALGGVYPIGALVRANASPGEGWLPADGSVYLNSAYPELAEVLGPMPQFIYPAPTNVTISGVGQFSAVVFAKGNIIGYVGYRIYTALEVDQAVAANYTMRLNTGLTSQSVQRLFVCEDDQRVFLWHAADGNSGTAQRIRYSDDGGVTWVDLGSANIASSQSASEAVRECRKLSASTYALITDGATYVIKIGPFSVTRLSTPAGANGVIKDGALYLCNGQQISKVTAAGTKTDTIGIANKIGTTDQSFFFIEDESGDAFLMTAGTSTSTGEKNFGLHTWRIRDFETSSPTVTYEEDASAWLGSSTGISVLNLGRVIVRNGAGDITGNIFLTLHQGSQVFVTVISKRRGERPVTIGSYFGMQSPVSSSGNVCLGQSRLHLGQNGASSWMLLLPTGYDHTTMFNVPSRSGHYVRAE